MEASRDLLDEYLLRSDNDLPRVLSLEEFEPIFDYCKELNSLNLRNKVTTFIMDGITKLRGLSSWAFVQCNMFLGQGDDSDKVLNYI